MEKLSLKINTLSLSCALFNTETGWAITAHAVGLGRPMDEHLQTTGKPVPGYNGMWTTLYTYCCRFFFNLKRCFSLAFLIRQVTVAAIDFDQGDKRGHSCPQAGSSDFIFRGLGSNRGWGFIYCSSTSLLTVTVPPISMGYSMECRVGGIPRILSRG